MTGKLNRRDVLKGLGIVGGGLVVGFPLAGGAVGKDTALAGNGFAPNMLLQITPEDGIHFYVPRAEMGQGVYEGMTTLLAEELEVDPEQLVIHHASVHKDYNIPGSPVQATGGSTSLSGHYTQLREVGAIAREAIRQAATYVLNVPGEKLVLKNGKVHSGEKSWPYGNFATVAAGLDLPDDVPLKKKDAQNLIGKNRSRADAWSKVTGTAEFGLDVEIPGMKRAALRRCPVAGGTVRRVRDAAARAMNGVHDIVEIHNGVAVLADTTWHARQAALALDIDWNLPPLAKENSDVLRTALEAALDQDNGLEGHDRGDGARGLDKATKIVEADYFVPYLAHATMEPMNCTADVRDGACEIWVGAQIPDSALGMAAHYAGVDRDQVVLHATFLGGGFGRRLTADYVAEAVAISKAAKVPVQLVWSREDDMRHDFYRPVSLVRFRAGIDAAGQVKTWTAKRAGPNIAAHFTDEVLETIMPQFLGWGLADWASKKGHFFFENIMVNGASIHGLYDDYAFDNEEIRHVTVDPGLPIGYWRSVGNSGHGFCAEGFIDELAHATKTDPLQFRLTNMAHYPKMQALLRLAAEKAGWGRAPKGHFQGIACHTAFGTPVVQIAEVSVDGDTYKIHRVTCAVDCGVAVNPEVIRQQMEGGIIFGLTAAVHGEITMEGGAVVQGNFDDYPMLRMEEAPAIDVHIMESDSDPTGVGEPGVPPIAVALTNALFAATGNRIRELPISKVMTIV